MKAYDFGELVKTFESKGLTLVEDGARQAFVALIEWLTASAQASATPYDDIIVMILPQIQKMVLGEIDKIDGKADAPTPSA